MAYPFVPSPHVTKTGDRKVDLVVIHTIESDEKGDSAESCAAWFRNPAAKVSAHYCVDANSIVQCVQEEDVAWHAPGANHDGIGIEHAGRARQTGREWADDYSRAMLALSAKLVAGICRRHGIPAVWLHPADLVAGKRGITSHDNVSKAFKRGTHWDPGTGFPIERYLTTVRKELKGAGAAPESKPLADDPPTLRLGASGWAVKRAQRLLRQLDLYPEPARIDGDYGEITQTAVEAFQVLNDIEQDGVVGPLTWRALVHAVAAKAKVREPVPA